MRKTIYLLSFAFATIICCSAFQLKKVPAVVEYPEGFTHWRHIKTTLVPPGSQFKDFVGFNHIYANDLAVTGYKTGKFPNGSILVVDVIEQIEVKGAIIPGNRYKINVMVRDSVRFASTAGWGFEEFKGDSRTERVASATENNRCFNCHMSREKTDYIFTSYKD